MDRLVLSRKVGQSVIIFVDDKEIEVFVSKINGNQVSLSFEADRDVEILREELTQLENFNIKL